MAGNDYSSQASSIYDPQASAERTQAQSALQSNLSDIEANKAELQPYYTKAFASLQSGEDTAQARQAQAAASAGIFNSGYNTSAANAITKTYASDRSSLGQEQAAKIADYERQAKNAQSGYQSALSSILDKYNGLKAQYVQQRQDVDAQNAFTRQMANEQNAFTARQNQLSINANTAAAILARQQSQSDAASARQKAAMDAASQFAVNARNAKGSGASGTREKVKDQINAMYGSLLPAGFLNNLIYNQAFKNYG